MKLVLTIASFLALSAAPASGQEHQHPPATPESPAPPAQAEPSPAVPPITDADREAAFPHVEGHTVHDRTLNYFVLVDQLEWLVTGAHDGAGWDNRGWVGGDLNRVWFRTEGAADGGRVDHAEAHLLYGRAIARWWDLVAGVRQDVRPGPAQTWAAVGVQGLAPYWFEVQATAYVGASGRTQVRLEVEYELLLTNRLVLQPLLEVDVFGKADPERGVGAGLSSADAGLRLRYELRRELAPYVGVVWTRKFLGTAELADGKELRSARLAVGLRTWF